MITFIDPLEIVIKAYKILYGDDKHILIQYNPNIRKILFFGHCGETEFLSNGNIVISLSPHITFKHVIEILAHELAHVAAGINQQHNKVWENCFDRINMKYDELFQEEINEKT